MQEVIVRVDAEGDVQVEARGVTGSGCLAVTKAIEGAIGVTTGDQKKPEFHQGAAQGQTQRAAQ